MTARFSGPGRSPERFCRPCEFWPAEDRARWLVAITPGDLLEEGGERAGYRLISNRKVERGYGRWLTFLEQHGLLHDVDRSDRICPANVEAYVRELVEFGNGSHTVLSRLQELHAAARAMDAERNWAWIRSLESRVRKNHKPVRDKRSKLVSTDDLVNLGVRLMKNASGPMTPRQQAMMYRDGLLVAFLAHRVFRLKNLAELKLGQHVIATTAGWEIRLSEDETKNGDPLACPWPDALKLAMSEWLNEWRPILSQRSGRWRRPIENALWVSSHGSPMSAQAIYDRVVKVTKVEFGTGINPHSFRHIAATTQAIEDPAHIGIAPSLLGHRSKRTTEKYYIQAGSLEVSALYQKQICELRKRHGLRKGSATRTTHNNTTGVEREVDK